MVVVVGKYCICVIWWKSIIICSQYFEYDQSQKNPTKATPSSLHNNRPKRLLLKASSYLRIVHYLFKFYHRYFTNVLNQHLIMYFLSPPNIHCLSGSPNKSAMVHSWNQIYMQIYVVAGLLTVEYCCFLWCSAWIVSVYKN